MASFIRGKQAGIQNDLSSAILPGLFAVDDRSRYGINSKISTLAYDPVQSLLAVGTSDSPFGGGQIYIFGRERVQVTFRLPRRASVKILQFCADKLISVDSKNELTVWDFAAARKLASYSPPGQLTCLVTDPMLDWAFIGLQQGEVIAYDLDRERLAPLRLPNFWRERNPRARILSVVCMQIHPRDIGQLLIGYTEGAVIYSFKQNKPTKYFQYEIPPNAPGGNSDPNAIKETRRPRLTHAVWHPSGTFIATAHDDGSLVFWDPYDGRVLMARTLHDTHIDQPGSGRPGSPMSFAPKDPYIKIAWCAKENPDDTGILIAGGAPISASDKGITFLELGPTPVYTTSSWQILSDHFKGKRQNLLQTPPGAAVADYCIIPRTSPHFAGAQDPIAVIALLSSGELITLSFPSGHPISPTNQLHPSLTFVHPFVISASVTAVDRTRWLGMTEKRQLGPQLLRGGAEAAHALRRYETRNIVQTAHGDGTVRLWDSGHSDQIENNTSLQIDVARALGRFVDIDITLLSMSGATGELGIGTQAGEVVIYRWGSNKQFGREPDRPTETKPGGITNISERSEPTLKEGLQPYILYDMMRGPITALRISDVGFVAVGSEGGVFSVMDLRGPAIIYNGSISEFGKQEKRSSVFGKSHGTQGGSKGEWVVAIEFGVMTLEGDEYSSICCFVGTTLGRVATFKILPQANGTYTAQLAGTIQLNDRIVSICPITTSGRPAVATGQVVAGLREGQQVNGTLVVATEAEARIFKPASGKGAQKTWDDSAIVCHSATVSLFDLHGYALVGIFGDGTTRAYSIPGLKELGAVPLPMLDRTRISSALVTASGDIIGWAGPSELATLNVWGTAQPLPVSKDVLFNPEALIPPRPTISNLQWIAGTQYLSPTDLDVLIGGPDRPPSKRMMEAAAEEERQARISGSSRTAAPSQEGWGEYMTRQLNERTEKLNIMGDGMDKVQENSAGWASDATSYVNKQKRGLLLKSVTGKFF